MFASELDSLLENYSRLQVSDGSEIFHTRTIKMNEETRTVSFLVIRDEDQRGDARDLLNDRYGWRGYGSAHDLQADIHHTTFAAEIDGQIVGTLTLGVDSDRGLAIDHTFSDIVDQARRERGTSICELTRLAFDESVRSKDVLAGLFHLAYIYGTTHTDCTDLFIEVNPRHLRFYELMLGFQVVGSMSTNASVSAPSRLMRIGVGKIGRNIREAASGTSAASSRSLYPHFFPAEDERQIRRLIGFPSAFEAGRLSDYAIGRLAAHVEPAPPAPPGAHLAAQQMRPAA